MSANNRMRVAIAGVVTATTLGSGLALAPSAEASTSPASTAISFAKAQLGDRYSQANPQGPNHWDCSGLVQASYKKAGKSLPRVAKDQYNSSKSYFVSKRKPGDLVFFGSSKYSVWHVGIYYGWTYKGKTGGWLLNANSGDYRGHKVVIAPIKEYGHVLGYKRVK